MENNNRLEYYQEGNTIRTRFAETAVPEEELLQLPPEQEDPRSQSRRHPRRRLDPAKLGVFVLLTMLTVLLAFGGLAYLRLNSSLTLTREKINAVERKLSKLKAANDLTASRMEADMNLAEVYQIATVQLGMVHGDGSETITYEEQLREYVRQYESIPGK